MAQRGARGPQWFVRVAAPATGLVVCAVAPGPRRVIAANLRRMRRKRAPLRDAVDVARTFVSYASCLADSLGSDAGHGPPAQTIVRGELHMQDALAAGRGVVLVTAHTAGWEIVGPVLARGQSRPVTVVEAPERDAAAGAIQDGARRAPGLQLAHAGGDPMAAIGLAQQLREGGLVAVQIDRAPKHARARSVTLFGEAACIPEGPLRLATLTGAPMVPAFASRSGHRRYEVNVRPPVFLARSAGDADLDRAAQHLARELETFVLGHPTQWFHFRSV
jgi:KDO2-lipid IV(A) lauroyltransferase